MMDVFRALLADGRAALEAIVQRLGPGTGSPGDARTSEPAGHHHVPALPAPAPLGGPRAAPGPELRDILACLWHHRWLLLAAGLASAVLGVLAGPLTPPRYVAEALLTIDAQQFNIPELQTLTSNDDVDPWAARSEAKVLTSRELVEQVVGQLGLADDPAFNPSLAPSPLASLTGHLPFAAWLSGLSELAGLSGDDENGAEDGGDQRAAADARARTVAAIRGDLEAESEERSVIVTLTYRGREPTSAAAFLNALIDAYIARDLQQKQQATLAAQTQIRTRMDALEEELEATQAEIRHLEARGEALETAQGSIRSQEAVLLTEQRLRLESERAALEADIGQVDLSLATDRLNLLNERLVTPRLEALWQTEAALQKTLAENALELGARHPQMQSAREQFERVRGELRREVRAVRASLVERAATLDRQLDKLGRQLEDNRQAAAAAAESRLRLRQLEDRARSKQALFDRYRELFEQTLANHAAVLASARPISRAAAPTAPSGPSAKLRAALGMALGLLCATAAIVARRWLTDRVVNLDDAVQATGVPPLGTVPWVGGWRRRGDLPALVIQDRQDPVTETVRGIVYRLGVDAHAPCQAVMVTSPLRGDGKSSLVAAMARSAAHDGLRSIAIDCDFHRPALARIVGCEPRCYLDQCGALDPPLEDLIVRDLSGADFILTRPVPDFSRADFARMGLDRLVASLHRHYDLIIIDTPPVLSVVDALFVSRLADAAILVLASRRISRRLTLEAVERLRGCACGLAGVVVSRAKGEAVRYYNYRGYAAWRDL